MTFHSISAQTSQEGINVLLDPSKYCPPKWGPPLEFINQRESASRFHRPKGGLPLNFINQKGSPPLWTISMVPKLKRRLGLTVIICNILYFRGQPWKQKNKRRKIMLTQTIAQDKYNIYRSETIVVGSFFMSLQF